MPFTSFSCLTATVRTSSFKFNIRDKSGHLVLFLILEEDFLLFTIEYDVSYKSVIYALYYIEVHSFYT